MYIQGTKTRLAKKNLYKKQNLQNKKIRSTKNSTQKPKLKKTRTRFPERCITTNINLMQKID
jgi:hypothetical protein